jgi:hypothetical protein
MESDPVFQFLAVSPKTVRVPRKGDDPFFDLTRNYTGDQGPRDSPHLYKRLIFRVWPRHTDTSASGAL